MDSSVSVSIPYDTALRITKLLKEDLRAIDREIKRSKTQAQGEIVRNVLKNKRKALRGCYDELKGAGVHTEDTTVVNDW